LAEAGHDSVGFEKCCCQNGSAHASR
jgi:hypothetical protein